MKKVAMFDTKPYDKSWFEKMNEERYEIHYFESKLNEDTVSLTRGYDVVCAFVNDDINEAVVNGMADNGVKLLAMRCAGYSNVDIKAANGKIKVVRVPAYSPYAVAEFAMGLLLTVNRKLHKAYNRTREYNFNINGLSGMDLYGKTVGVIGTGKIGQVFVNICKGFGMRVLCYDPYPIEGLDAEYVSLEELLGSCEVISLHCPLTDKTWHIIDEDAISKMKKHCYIINTSRGAIVDEPAMCRVLAERPDLTAVLDVTWPEPPPESSPLFSLENVVLTPPIAGSMAGECRRMGQFAIDDCRRFLKGEKLQYQVTEEMAAKMA